MASAIIMEKDQKKYKIWIEAEEWIPGSWSPEDTNTDVIVTLEEGTRWVASFFTYKNIQTLGEKNKRTGEELSGKYFWSTDMLLVDEVSRQRIEEVIQDLMGTGYFENVFTQLSDEKDEG